MNMEIVKQQLIGNTEKQLLHCDQCIIMKYLTKTVGRCIGLGVDFSTSRNVTQTCHDLNSFSGSFLVSHCITVSIRLHMITGCGALRYRKST